MLVVLHQARHHMIHATLSTYYNQYHLSIRNQRHIPEYMDHSFHIYAHRNNRRKLNSLLFALRFSRIGIFSISWLCVTCV